MGDSMHHSRTWHSSLKPTGSEPSCKSSNPCIHLFHCAQTVTFTDSGTGTGVTSGGGKLPAGLYSTVSTGFTNGAAAGGVTFTTASSVPSLPLAAFQVLPVRSLIHPEVERALHTPWPAPGQLPDPAIMPFYCPEAYVNFTSVWPASECLPGFTCAVPSP